MYRFSFVNSVSGKATEVTKEMFYQIIRSEKVKSVCKQIADLVSSNGEGEVGALKRKLPAFCWHAWFDEGKRKNDAAHASGLIMIDVDHITEPARLFADMRNEKIIMNNDHQDGGRGHRLLAAHITPSTQGLRLVFAVPEGCKDLMEAQTRIVNDLKLKNVDACTKDLARLSFCVPEEYFLYLDEKALFSLTPALSKGEGEEKIESTVESPEPQEETIPDSSSLTSESREQARSLIPHSDSSEPAFNANASELLTAYPSEYDGIAYPILVESLQELLGGVPAHGSRNNFIFSMAAYLRYVCNDDPEWIAQILPTYGEAHDKWRRTIDSACQRSQYKAMPQIVKRAIVNARQKSLSPISGEQEGAVPPAMPAKLPKLIAHLIKNVPEVCRPAVANAVFPALAAHLNGVKFWLIDGTEKEATFMCVTMAPQSSGKSAVNKPIEYIVADIVERDELNRKREQDWKDASANKGANKEKPKRPDDLCVQVLVSDMTNAAFVQRMKDAGGRYLYTNLEELDLLKQLQTNGTKDVGKIICLCFDNGKYGQERVGTQSVTARVDLRWNWNASSTIQKGIKFFDGRMVDGTLSRVNFCTIIPDKSKPFVYGHYDEQYAETLKPFITNLNLANGHVECKQALEMARKMSERCAEEGALTDDDIYSDLAHRAVTIAYLKAMVLYIANDMTWSNEIADFAQWSLDYDLWCKNYYFGQQVEEEKAKEIIKKRHGRQNLLDLLPECFSLQEVQDVRIQAGMNPSPNDMIKVWVSRGYVEKDATGRYAKTDKYLAKARQ